MNKLVKDALVLTAITLIAGVCLGGVYEITKDPIAKAQESATQESYKAVFADAASFEDLEGFDADAATKIAADAGYTDDDITNCVVAKDDAGQAIGYVITITSHAGYGGDITFSMGVTNDGTLNGYSITDISETAGLGMKAKDDPSWGKQFAGKKVESFSVVKDGSGSGDDAKIDAISGATITSKAVTGAMNSCLAYFQSLEGGN